MYLIASHSKRDRLARALIKEQITISYIEIGTSTIKHENETY